MTPEQKRIAAKIRASREALGLTQAQAAAQLGMSVRAYEIAGILSIYEQIKEGFARGKKGN